MPFALDEYEFETDEILKDLQHVKACVSRRWMQMDHELEDVELKEEPGIGPSACLVTASMGVSISYMTKRLPSDFERLVDWNDVRGRTKAEVIAFLDGCIAARQQEIAEAVYPGVGR